MSRLADTFAGLRARKAPGLVTYVTAGDPDLERTAGILRALDRAGADVIEVGVPFSDPLADGPVIQRATERALEAGNIELTHSISAGLDYAAVGPEHAWLRELGRCEYGYVTDAGALAGFQALAKYEGILPALESAHAVAYAMTLVKSLPRDAVVLVNLSGRGDKDVQSVVEALDVLKGKK